ncbi:MAG: hypothetical protein ACYTFW_26040 [Planctomycetota bacterium]|jgi:hypothetical protein
MAEVAQEQRLEKASLYDRLSVLRRAGLLTGIKTSGLNTFSNFTHGITETGKDFVAWPIDSAMSVFTGKKTVGRPTLKEFLAAFKGAGEGAVKGWDYLWTGVDERHIGEKYDYQRIYFGDSKFAKGLQAYEEFVFHMMGAEDQPFYYAAKSRSIVNQSVAEASKRKLKGAAKTQFINKMLSEPSDIILERAVHDAETAVFQNRTMVGDLARAIHEKKPGDWIVPFSRTPAAVGMQILNYSPVGVVKELADQVATGKLDQRFIAQAAGRSVIGTGTMYLGAKMFTKGLISLGRPKSEREKELWQAEGRKANAVLIDGKWRGVNVLGPAGMLLLAGGYFQRGLDEEGSVAEAGKQAFFGAAKSFSEQTLVTGISQAAKALEDPEHFGERYFTGMASSFVLTLVADIARATDDVERRSEGVLEAVQSRIPGVRRMLEPRINVYGQDVPRYGGNPMEVMLDPTRPAKVRRDVVVEEIRRLWDNDIKVAPTKLGDRHGYSILTAEENTTMWRRAGDLVYIAAFEIMQGRTEIPYKELTDAEKGKVVDKIVKNGQDTARAEIAIHKMSQGVTIEVLRESKLVTDDVAKTMAVMGAR